VLVTDGRVDEYASALRRLADAPAERERLGAAAAEYARREFGLARVLARWDEVLSGVVARRQRRHARS
jgi:glycosyltransferase involved in cell wall biosynthesis